MHLIRKKVKRPYDSSHRQEQAAETRRRIIAAAYDLFVERGYSKATLGDIAAKAGVAVETVYAAFGTKAELLRRVWYVHFRGDERDETLYDRPEMQAILAEPDLFTRIRQHARFVTANNRRIAPLLDMLTGAASSEPGAAAMLAEWAERRLDVATKYARAAAATSQLAIPEAACRDLLFATMDGALWHRLVLERGWSDAQYADWLSEFWISQFVGTKASRRRDRR
jgi:AcrR family transcriptional regulator